MYVHVEDRMQYFITNYHIYFNRWQIKVHRRGLHREENVDDLAMVTFEIAARLYFVTRLHCS
uniref:Uncharacterized protein n=1 Tax=Arion vulgaris TaxID=1028688 RepID=A0A0B7BQJ7_9EUPU